MSDSTLPKDPGPDGDTSGGSTRGQGPTDDVAAPVDLDAAPGKDDIRTVFDLVHYAYGRKGRKLATLKKSTIASLGDGPDVTADHLTAVQALAETDHDRLAVPIRLMHTALEQGLESRARQHLLQFVAANLGAHPLLHDEVVTVVVEGGPDHDPEQAIRQIGSLAPDEVSARLESDLTPKAVEELHTNAVHALSLFVALRDDWTPRQLASVLHEALWQPQAISAGQTSTPLVALTSQVPTGHLAIVVEIWNDEIDRARDRAVEERRLREDSERRAEKLSREMDQIRDELDAAHDRERNLNARIAELEAGLQYERKTRQDGQAHASYDYEQLRAKSVKRMKKQTELLEEGLHALRRDPPIVQVGVDRMERTLDRLQADLDDLRADRGLE